MKSLLPVGFLLVLCVVSTSGQMNMNNYMQMAMLQSLMNPSGGASGGGGGAGRGGVGGAARGGGPGSRGGQGRGRGAGGLTPALAFFNRDLYRDLMRCQFQRMLFGNSGFGRILYHRCQLAAYA